MVEKEPLFLDFFPESPEDPQPRPSEATVPEDGGAEPEGEDPGEKKGEDENDEGGGEDETEVAVTMPERNRGCCSGFLAWFCSNAFSIYAAQFLSSWGDRMWTFAVALYLVEIENNNLRLTAVFGFALAISVLLFGPLVGNWVDRTPRLSATTRCLVIQNFGVMIDAVCLLFLLHYKEAVLAVGNGVPYLLCQVLIITLGVIANLASVAQKICIEKDWVVILAGDNKQRLAEMNANVRRIDLTVNVMAPILVGQIMTYGSMTIAGIFIAGWNLISLVVEYCLLLRVYKKVPRLSVKFSKAIADNDTETSTEARTEQSDQTGGETGTGEQASPGVPGERNDEEIESAKADQESASAETQPLQPRGKFGFLRRIANWFLSIYYGWLVFKSYPVYLAGLGLAFLYMTVMGFNSITDGYGYTIGLSEGMLGVMKGLGSIAGIVGTVIFQQMRKRIGVTRTGLYALGEELACLTLCVWSIWVPGSPFDPGYYIPDATTVGPTDVVYTTPAFHTLGITTPPFTPSNTTQSSLDPLPAIDLTSAILFFTGMITSRVGLWMFDLVTTQLIQENVREDQRGIFNAMQRALECSMDMLHFILVIALPTPETFGYLIIVSMVFITTGAVLYSTFAFRDRGHLFHPEKFVECIQKGRGGRMRVGMAHRSNMLP